MLNYSQFSYFIKVLIFTTTSAFYTIDPSQAQSIVGLQFGKCYSKYEVIEGSSMFYDFSESYDHKGLLVKLFYSYSLVKQLSIKQNIGYEKRGAIIERDYGWVGYDEFSLNYLNLSTSLNFHPIKFVSFYFGLNYNYLIKAVDYCCDNSKSTSTDLYRKFDIGYNLGSKIVVKGFFIEASLFRSIKPIWVIDISTINPSLKNTEYRNNSLDFSIGYQMDLNKMIERKYKNSFDENKQ